MPLTREQIVAKELEYFNSPLAAAPAFIRGEFDEFYDTYQDDKCVYKTEDGRKCAVGALIKPAHYDPGFDANNGTPVDRLSDQVLNYLGTENVDWLKKLQACHDDCARNWESEKEYSGEDHFGRYFLSIAKSQSLL